MMSKLTKLTSEGHTETRKHGDTEQRFICIDVIELIVGNWYGWGGVSLNSVYDIKEYNTGI